MLELLVRGGTVVDVGGCRRADVLVADGVVAEVGEGIDVPAGVTVLDAGGCLVAPGLVDLHTHLRQPGREEAETVETGARAAALGGYTAVVAMPNTEPAIDSAGVAREVLDLGPGSGGRGGSGRGHHRRTGGRATGPLGRAGRPRGAAFHRRRRRGAGRCRHAASTGLRPGAGCHPGPALRGRAPGRTAGPCTRAPGPAGSGIPGVPAAAEEVMVARDIALVRLTGAPVHFLHLSTAGSVELVRRAKAEGLPVTAEAAPHHFALTDARWPATTRCSRSTRRCAPPTTWRRVKAGLADGTIDAIATDHAPHAPEAKEVPFDQAPPGMLGLETALAVALTELPAAARAGAGPHELAARGSRRTRHRRHAGRRPQRPRRPRRPRSGRQPLCGRPGGHLDSGRGSLASRSRNTPYAGRKLTGRVRHTVLRASRWWSTPRPSDDGRGRDFRPPEKPAAGPAARAPALLVLADGEVFEGEAAGARAAGLDRRGRLQHRAVSGYQEVVTDPSYAGQVVAFTYPHIGNYGTNAADDEAPRPVLPRRRRPRPDDAAEQLAGDRGTRGVPRPPRHPGDHRDRHPPADPAPARPPARCRARSARPARPSCRRPRPRPSRTDGRDLVAEVTTTEPYVRRRRPVPGRRLRLRHQGDDAPPARRDGTVDRRPGRHAGRRRAGDGARRRLPLQRPRRPGRPARSRPSRSPSCSGRVPVFGICLGHQLLATALGGTTYKLPFGHHGGNHPVQRLVDGPGRDDQPEPQLRGASTSPTRT